MGASPLPALRAEEAITMIFNGLMPMGYHPAEGYQVHLTKLEAFMNSDQFGHLEENQVKLFGQYIKSIAEGLQHEQQQQAQLEQANQFAKAQGGQEQEPQGPGGPPAGNAGPPMIQNTPMDKSLPGSNVGGGANG
jgi:hypothetical protein